MRIGLPVLIAVLSMAGLTSAQAPIGNNWTNFPQRDWREVDILVGDDGHVMLVNWQDPPNSGEYGALIHNTALVPGAAEFFGFSPGNVLAFSGERCPEGWAQKTTDDGVPLFYAFGLLVDENGEPHSGFQRLPACEKQP